VLGDMPREELIVSTKAGYRMWPGPYGDHGSKKYMVASLDQSLQRLGLDYVDIFYHHRPDPHTPLEETLGAMDLLVKQGKALYVGVSNYDGRQFRDACDVIARHNWSPITIHQPRYNMLDRKPESDLFPHTAAAGTGVITYSPLSQGRLTDRYLDGLPEDSRWGKRGERGRQWYEEQERLGILDKSRKLREVARRRGQTLAQLAITWQLMDERITSVVVGVSKVRQLKENVEAATAEGLSDDELDEIERILSE
jgi:L-glyceraldehyde 3-phosphate reductase